MPLRRSYSIGSLLVATAVVAVVLALVVPMGLLGPLFLAALAGMPLVEAYGPLGAYGPGAVAILVLMGLAIVKPRLRLGALGGVLAAGLSLTSPHLLAWWTWHIQNDHTANIGAGILYGAQAVLAPTLAVAASATVEVLVRVLTTADSEAETEHTGPGGPEDWRPPLPPGQ